jgi:hypothetical protein
MTTGPQPLPYVWVSRQEDSELEPAKIDSAHTSPMLTGIHGSTNWHAGTCGTCCSCKVCTQQQPHPPQHNSTCTPSQHSTAQHSPAQSKPQHQKLHHVLCTKFSLKPPAYSHSELQTVKYDTTVPAKTQWAAMPTPSSLPTQQQEPGLY